MKPTFNIIISFFIVLPVLLLSYQLGTPEAITTAHIAQYLSEPALKLTLAAASKDAETEKNLPIRKLEIPDFQSTANSALAWDFKENFYFFTKETNTARPIASLTKLISAAVVLDYVQPQENVVVSLEAVKKDGNSGNLREGEILTVKDLLAAALLESSNDAAYALAEHVGAKLSVNPESNTTPVRVFVKAMNQKFNDLGLVHTNFTDPAGLEDINSFSTAEDLAKFIKYFRTNPNYSLAWDILKLKNYHTESQNRIAAHDFKNTNPFLEEYAHVIGGKTGYTARALGNMLLVVAGPNSSEIIYLILGADDRESETRKLVEWVAQAWTWPQEK